MIDDKSLQILKILQEKARIPNTEVSRQVGLAPSAVLERIRKLENQGIIDGYEVRLNPQQFNRNQIAFITVSVDLSVDINGNIGRAFAELEEVQEVHFMAGIDSYLIKLRVSSAEELDGLLRHAIAITPGVTGTKTLMVLSTFKETARIPIR